MYSFDSKVRYSEVGSDNKLSVGGIVNYFQDCTLFHSESIGRGISGIREIKKGWVLSSWQIIIKERPAFMKSIKVSTWPTGFKGLYGTRNFTLEGEEGQVYAYANSIWAYLDLTTGHPTRIGEDEIKAYGIEEPLKMEYAPRKITLLKPMKEEAAIPIRKNQIDTNHHVNNSQYIIMAMESINKDNFIGELRAEYKMSAKEGDIIYPKSYKGSDKEVIKLCNGKEDVFAIVEIKETNHVN